MRVWRAWVARLAARFSSTPRPVDRVITDMLRGSGRVTRTDALSVPAVLRARNLICSVATLPLVQYASDWRAVPLPLLQQIDPDVPNVITLAQTLEDLLFESISWWRVLERGADRYPTYCRRVDPSAVSLTPPSSRSVALLPGGYDPRGAVLYVDGVETPAQDMIRFDSPNPPLLIACGRTIRRALQLDQAAEVYADGGRPLDYFSPADGADEIDDDEVDSIIARWQARRRKTGTAWLPAAMKYNSVDSPSPADLQLVELQQRAALDVANGTGLDPEELGVSTTSRTYANVTDRRRDKINDTLSPYMSAITDRLSMGDVTKRGFRIAFDLDEYLRADPITRWSTYQTAKTLGAITVDEIRAEEKMPPLTAAQRAAAAPPPAPAGDNVLAFRPTGTRFDGAQVTFGTTAHAQFKVDASKRTIEGIAVPYGAIGRNGDGAFRFTAGALQYADVGRVKLLRDHDFGQPIGVLVEAKDTDAGMFVRYRVARGPEGDAALSLAEDGVLDGFSVGIDFNAAADTVPDPDNEDVTLIRRADWRETSLTAMPAFDDARVTRVAAHRNGEATMHTCATCGATLTPGVAHTCPTTAPAVTAEEQQFESAVAAALERLSREGPQFVNPIRPTAVTQVTDPESYVFDRRGNLRAGAHSFSRDIVAHVGGDNNAHQRVMDFVRKQFADMERQEFVVTTDVAGLNPNRQRPDLYVDQREFLYPVWEAINKGTLQDITPFTFPKFSSSSGLVAAHVEGTEPSLGTFVATTQTVTPAAVSGKIKLSRETVDQVGNPQTDSLIWRQMLRAWFEALEAKALALFTTNAASITDITITTAAVDSALDQAVTAAFASLQYIRGGFIFDRMYTQIDLYKALVAAKDTAGRRLYPSVGPMNASGTTERKYASIDINGVIGLPAWATAASGVVAASSWMFDRESAHGWATAPQRIDIDRTEVANVYIGLWGYTATAISDFTGTREVIYDPV